MKELLRQPNYCILSLASFSGGNAPIMQASHYISEERTRKEMIDPQLEKAGWYLRDHSKVKTEIPVDGYDAEPFNGITDYCLYRENGEVLAVVAR